jgi:geranylgeranyl diphosphate synthase, type II
MRTADELRALVETGLEELPLWPELSGLEAAIRYALDGGGKRIRPVLCLATAEAAGGDPEHALPAGLAVELVHTFSLVHDDLPALDDDDVRRGRASVHVEFGDGIAVIAGDALLAEGFRLALSYARTEVARELAECTLGMIGGQFLDVFLPGAERLTVTRLKTGRLFDAAVACGLWAADVPAAAQGPWRAFGAELGVLFQLVDDIIDGDGLAAALGEGKARALADEAAARAQGQLDRVDADTSVLAEIVAVLAARTA